MSIKIIFTGNEQQTLFKPDYNQKCNNKSWDITNYELYKSPVQNSWQKNLHKKNKNLKIKNKKTTIRLMMARLQGKLSRCKMQWSVSKEPMRSWPGGVCSLSACTASPSSGPALFSFSSSTVELWSTARPVGGGEISSSAVKGKQAQLGQSVWFYQRPSLTGM